MFKQLLSLLQEWLELLTPIGIAIAFVWRIWLKNKIKEANEIYKVVQKMAEEFKPNGGSSLRDAINRIESKVDLQEQKIVAIIKSSPMGTWIADKDGKWSDVNKPLCDLLDRTESELKGDNWMNWIVQDDKIRVATEWDRGITKLTDFDATFRIMMPSDDVKSVHATAYQLRAHNGDLIGYLGTMYLIDDVRRRK